MHKQVSMSFTLMLGRYCHTSKLKYSITLSEKSTYTDDLIVLNQTKDVATFIYNLTRIRRQFSIYILDLKIGRNPPLIEPNKVGQMASIVLEYLQTWALYRLGEPPAAKWPAQ